jgi:DNA-binding NarL/FixJ family response regulator
MKASTPIFNIALVDDHKMFRSGIAALLNEYADIHILFEANNGIELQNKIAIYPDTQVILMDINMPQMNGYISTQWVKKNHPHIQILALSMYDDEQAIIKMLKAGASGYILKEAEISELHKAIIHLVEKGFYTNDLVSGNLIRSIQKENLPAGNLKLTEKELLFLQLCASELTYKEMAEQLDIAIRSVDNYSRSLFEKTGAKSRVGLVLWGIKNNLIST